MRSTARQAALTVLPALGAALLLALTTATGCPSTSTPTPTPTPTSGWDHAGRGAGAPLPAAETTLTRIAFGSCASQARPQPIWDAVAAAEPQLFIFGGDNVYADTEDRAEMRAAYEALAAKPGFQRLAASTPIVATWDDHDYGVNDGDRTFPAKAMAQDVMLDFFGEPADSPRRRTPGVFTAHTFGPPGRRVQVVLLDTRTFKSPLTPDPRSDADKAAANVVGWYAPNPDPALTMLGDAQWAWLEARLREPADLRLLVSSVQVVSRDRGMEGWGNLPTERARLFQLIAETSASGVVFLSGDVHFSELSATVEGPYPLHDLTSSSLTHGYPSWSTTRNDLLADGPYADPNFALVTVAWDAPGGPTVTLETRGVDGSRALGRTIPLTTLRPAPDPVASAHTPPPPH